MAQRNLRASTPVRRSGRLSNQGGSVAAESVVTTVTTGGTRTRGKTALSSLQPRKSNAYGASGRLGNPEKIPAAVTGFTEAFQNQRGDALDGEDGEDIDELAAEPSVSQPRQQSNSGQPPTPAPRNGVTRSKVTPGYSFIDSDGITPSEDDAAASVGNTSKSFGLGHEAGMLMARDNYDVRPSPFVKPAIPKRNPPTRTVNGLSGQASTPHQPQVSARGTAPTPGLGQAPVRGQGQGQAGANLEHPTVRITASERLAINQSVDELIAEEQARLAQEGPPLPQPRRRPHQKAPSDLWAWIGNVQQDESEEDEPVWPWRKLVMWAFWALAAFLVVGWLLSHAMSTEYPESAPRMPAVFKAVGSRVAYTYDKITDFIAPPRGPTEEEKERAAAEAYKANGEDHLLWGRMSQIEQRNVKRMESMRELFEELKQELPDLMVVKRYEDGSSEISDDFWRALTSKAKSAVRSDPEWVAFLTDTKEKLDALLDNQAHNERTYMEAWPQAVSREEFISHIENRYQNLTLEVDKKIEDAIHAQAVQLKSMFKEEAKRAMMDQVRLSALAESNLVANYQVRFNRPNYFSPGLGAIVDPSISSVTFNDAPGRIATMARRFSWTAARNPPMAALTKWEEPGDCWCSAPSEAQGPQAQLVVNLARPVTPKQVTIEHIPMSMMPSRNISNAPRDIELWVQTDLPINPYYSHRQVACKGDGPPAQDGLPFKCLGAFKYNIHASNHLQTFDLSGESAEPIRKAVVRVTSNWGASHTCLYQLRLHGTDAAPDHEYEVRLMD
jgi:SUN domain-containing protein 1/2